jgi:serine/threonine-protein kinase
VAAAGLVSGLAAAGGAVWWLRGHNASLSSQAGVAEAQLTRGAIAIASDPAGAAIVINGEKRTEKTPATIGKLSIGAPYQVTLSKEGFQDATQGVTLTDQEPSGALSLVLQRATFAIDVSTSPSVPAVTLVLDNKPYASTSIDKVTAGEGHQLVVQAPGFASQSFSVVGAPDEHKHFDVTLVRKEASRSDERPGRTWPGPAPAAVAAPPAVNAGTGKLNVSAHGGWCNVTVDGTPRGPTPIAGIVLPVGAHAIQCTPEGGKPLSASVRIEADSTARYAFALAQQ